MSSDNSGNSGFSHVVNVASPIDTLNVGSVVAGSVSVAGEVTVVGYAPTNATTVSSFWLNNVAGVAAQTTIVTPASTTLILPQGATITRVEVDNNGTTVVGPTSFNIGTLALTTATTQTNIASAILTASVNAVGGGQFSCQSAFASAGNAGVLVTAANTGVTISNVGAIITAGLVVVTITYVI